MPADKDAWMPGAWICDKCGFVLQKNILHAADGAISADTCPINNVCPNDTTLMRPMTWREVNEGLFKQVCELREGAKAIAEAVVSNHKWHEEYDDYDGYPESDLCEKNCKAIGIARGLNLLPR